MHGSGIGVIMNKQYRIVKRVRSSGPTDLHEFRLTSEGTALVTAYRPRFENSLWVLDSVFQEISLSDGNILFEWSALDHVNLSESHVPPGSYALLGDGLRSDHSWDYFHINSIDKNDAGDYLISSRHTDCVIKISRVDGSVMWRLHGDSSSFHLANFTFRRQHHARFREETKDRTVISLFNNDDDGHTAKGLESTGMIVEIDHLSNVAHKVAEFKGPTPGGLLTSGSGSMSFLPDERILLSWGRDSAMAEYLPGSTPIWYAHMGWDAWNYRTYKANWTGEPLQQPALWTYAASIDSPTKFYASWNGATEVRLWRFYTSKSEDGPYELVGSQVKTDFETTYSHGAYEPWAFAEAIDTNGQSLGNSSTIRTYVPTSTNATDDCELPYCTSNTLGISSKNDQHRSKAVTEEATTAGSQVIVTCWDRSRWRYLEHLMAVLGTFACLATFFWIPYTQFRQFSSYQVLKRSDF